MPGICSLECSFVLSFVDTRRRFSSHEKITNEMVCFQHHEDLARIPLQLPPVQSVMIRCTGSVLSLIRAVTGKFNLLIRGQSGQHHLCCYAGHHPRLSGCMVLCRRTKKVYTPVQDWFFPFGWSLIFKCIRISFRVAF